MDWIYSTMDETSLSIGVCVCVCLYKEYGKACVFNKTTISLNVIPRYKRNKPEGQRAGERGRAKERARERARKRERERERESVMHTFSVPKWVFLQSRWALTVVVVQRWMLRRAWRHNMEEI